MKHIPGIKSEFLRVARALGAGLLVPLQALARPGGGGGFHSGGHSGGFSGGSHGAAGGGHYGGVPYAGTGGSGSPGLMLVILAIFLLFWLLSLYLRRKAAQADLEPAPGEPGLPDRARSGLEQLGQLDPEFSTEGLDQRTIQLADILREAWCAGDMRPARAFVSDGVFCRYTTQLGLMHAAGQRNVMADARILAITVVGVELSAPLEIIQLRVDAEARDCMVPLTATAEQIAADLRHAPKAPYSEIWSLVRRQGTLTKAGPARIGNCPSCGAPLGSGEVIQCQYCHALVNSGAYDWVLAEITQLSAWIPARTGAIPGFHRLQAGDPGLAAEVLQDRVSYLFWKWIEACSKGSAVPLRKCSSAAFQGAIPPCPALHDVAVGGVQVVECLQASEPGGMDRVYAKVFWSGACSPRQTGTFRVQVLQLVRRTGVHSDSSFSALLCHSCGAPLSASDSDCCDHCHAQVATGDQSWILDRVLAESRTDPID